MFRSHEFESWLSDVPYKVLRTDVLSKFCHPTTPLQSIHKAVGPLCAQKWFHQKNEGFDSFTKIAKNGRDWGKLIVAVGFKKLPKVQKIAQSGHTGHWYT